MVLVLDSVHGPLCCCISWLLLPHCSVVQVLDGYIFLGSAETLGREVVGAFSAAVNTATLKVVSLQCCIGC